MANGVNPGEPMAIVAVPYGDILLNADDAFALFKILCKAEFIEYNWTDKAYKRKELSKDNGASLKAFSPVDYAALTLNSTD